MTTYLYLMLMTLLLGCGLSPTVANQINSDLKSPVIVSNDSVTPEDKSHLYDGLYLNQWNNSGVLIIHSNKIHHFNRNEYTSMYKDEQYDYKGLHENGNIFINRRYRLDRKNKVMSKETILSDIEPVIENGKAIAMIRNGRRFNRMETFADFLSEFDSYDVSNIEALCISELKVTQSLVQKALNHSDYYILSGLHYRQLRDGQIEFKEILSNIVKSLK